MCPEQHTDEVFADRRNWLLTGTGATAASK